MSLPGKNCPWISLATAFGFPNNWDMRNAPPHATDTWTHIGALAGVVALKSLGPYRVSRPTPRRDGEGRQGTARCVSRPLPSPARRVKQN